MFDGEKGNPVFSGVLSGGAIRRTGLGRLSAKGEGELFNRQPVMIEDFFLPIGLSEAKARGSARYRCSPGAICRKCGGIEHRTIRRDCQGCRALKSPHLKLVRAAVHRAIAERPFTGRMTYSIGVSSSEFRAWLVFECGRKRFQLEDYGKRWQVYHKRELSRFDLRLNSACREVNRLDNLEVRKRHNSSR